MPNKTDGPHECDNCSCPIGNVEKCSCCGYIQEDSKLGKRLEKEFDKYVEEQADKYINNMLEEQADMLKIKDDVDLKELEKFGFEISSNGQYADKTIKLNDKQEHELRIEIGYDRGIGINLNKWCKQEENEDYYYLEDELDTIYDLIKADLVEKVSD